MPRTLRALCRVLTLAVASGLGLAGPAAAEGWQVEYREPPFDFDRPALRAEYRPLARAARPWRFCISYPHLKDAYWLSVNYGMAAEAARLGVRFRLVEAGGYPNLSRQIEQIEQCLGEGADALIVGAVSYDGLSDLLERVSRTMPVIASVNDVADRGVTAKVGVSWRDMGHAAGQVIARAHPAGSAPVRVAWFPGPEGAGWVRFVDAGFREALAGSAAEIVETLHGDTGLDQQVQLVETALARHGDLDYIAGSAPTAEAAISVLRSRGLDGRIGIVSDYMTHAVMRGLQRGKVLAAPTDHPVLQGRLSIEMAVRAVEGSLERRHVGPPITLVSAGPGAAAALGAETLAPASFAAVFDGE